MQTATNRVPSPDILNAFAPVSPVAGVEEICAHQAVDTFALWQAWEKECGVLCDTPFWAVVWPAARVLGRYIRENPELVRGKRVLDLGCGCGVVSVAASLCGAARVLGSDIDPVALHMARLNAAANNVSVTFDVEDLTLVPVLPERFDLILIADMFYQKGPSLRMTAWLASARAAGMRIIIADSGRAFLPAVSFVRLHAATVAVDADVEGVGVRHVDVLEWE